MENILIIGGGNLCLEVITYLKDITVFSKRKFNLIGVVEPRKIDKKSGTKKLQKIRKKRQ